MRAVKILLGTLAAVLALVVVGAVVVASLFDPNDYKGALTEAFTARTGRSLKVGQDLHLAYFPWLAVETGDIEIGNALGFGADGTPFATVKRVAARVKLLPLLSRRIEIGTVELDGLTLDLARDAEERGNWEDLTARDGAAGTAPRGDGASAAPAFAIEGVRVRDGSVYWRDGSELKYSATGIALDVGSVDLAEPIDFDAALNFKDEASGSTATLAASARVALGAQGAVAASKLRVEATLAGGPGARPRTWKATADEVAFERATQTLTTSGVVTDVDGVRAAWELAGSGLVDDTVLTGRLEVAAAPLAAVFDALDWPPPAGLDRDELGAFDLSTRFEFRAAPRSIALSELTLGALGVRVQGSGTLAGASALSGRIEIPEFAPSPAVLALLRAAVPPTVDVTALDRLGLATRFEADLDTGRAALRDVKASALGATINANLEALPGSAGNTFRGNVTTSRFPAEAFAKAFAALLPPNLAPAEIGAIELDTRFSFDSGADSVTASPFTVELFGLRATGEVAGRNVSSAARWTGSAKVAQFSPQDLLKRFGLPPQPTSDPKAFTRATIETRFTVDKAQAALTNVVLALDESRITGDFTLEGFTDPAYRFALVVDNVDADRYLPPPAKEARAGEATAGDIELPENNTMNLDGTMQVGALTLAGLKFQDVAGHIVIAKGDMTLDGARARLYGGAFNGTFRVRAAGSSPGLALDGHATTLDLAPLIEDLTGEPANFSGKGTFDLSLAGKGRTVIANVGSAAGNVSFKMDNGAVKGFNLGRTLCSTYNATQKVAAPAGQQPKQTEYEVMQGTATVEDGTANTQDLLARTSFMDIYGGGTLALVEQRLDFDLDAKLTGKIAIPGCETLEPFIGDRLPFDIHGTVTEPTIRPDFSKLAQRKLREEVQDRLKDKLRDILR